ncbi:MAG TPA: PPOX class F420-dependent oxidoreductase, partial [Ktedonobacteraceae bacterium]|nr:PPOX class F420-dependent oxidoreductase [Ktedonobacteraceae bacterium]
HVVPIWFLLDGDTIVFMTGNDSVKAANMKRDHRICFCVDDENPPYAYVLVEGIALIGEDSKAKLDWSTRIAARYMGADKAESYGKRNAVPSEHLVRVTPTKILFLQNIAN